jgi:hypothetical protein
LAIQELRDPSDALIGRIEEDQNHHRVSIIVDGDTLGWFLPEKNITFDENGRAFGPGNQLLRLLPSEHQKVRLIPV